MSGIDQSRAFGRSSPPRQEWLSRANLPSAKRRFAPLDIWVAGHFRSFTDDRNKAAADGHFGVLYLGADYVVRPWLLVGALVQYNTMQQRSVTQAFDIKGSGWMAGPYATVRLSENIFLQGRLAAGRSNNEVSPFLTYTDTFSTKRWLASSTLVGRWQFGNWQIQPSASISYIEDVSEAYTDSLGVSGTFERKPAPPRTGSASAILARGGRAVAEHARR